MSGAQVEQRGSGLDIFKWVVVAALVLAGAVGNAYFAEQSLLYRVLALVAVAAVAGLIALNSAGSRPLDAGERGAGGDSQGRLADAGRNYPNHPGGACAGFRDVPHLVGT